MGFKELGIHDELIDILLQNGIGEPTPIQKETIPVILEGKDVVGQAQTGTGKTLAFVLPLLQKVDAERDAVQGLIVAPTRELAIQITAEVRKLTEALGEINVLAVYGGQDVIAQMHKLEGKVHVVVATPGRLLDHIRRETIDLSHVSTFVLDEADQMLHIGFLDDIEDIMYEVPEDRQTLLFSATMPDEVKKLAETYTNDPQDIHVKTKQITLKEIRQRIVETTDRGKQNDLVQTIRLLRPYLAIIFCRTKRRASKLNEALQNMGYNSDELHGDLSQAKREDVMRRFREGEIQFLVATDVAARGLDVDGVTHVFNYDIALDAESYIHRIGRTGRAGGKGLAVTFVAQKDRRLLQIIERETNQKLNVLKLEYM
ncbi:MAG: DEAD/DEAH box helicase [Bacillota bacterium]|uniref:DEAD/DEAH box helicase n=1 Tax=Fictibacillus sp. 18YEL24 TaxID=2745875 RepID=UPI0018CE6F57|nr:DEAD/DEAH box helicase [Fictibacillus sp. 18YEL24]MBH0168855.1 DEAD/DEAH box helicase [Fictibacillus sp. 18YEL24]